MDLRKGVSVHALALNIIGAVLVFAGVGLAGFTARGLIDYRAAAAQHGGEVADLGANARPQAGQYGTMARIVGTPVVVTVPHDPDFNLWVKTPVLIRHVEMFQWREVSVGGRVHYELDWVDHLLDARAFQQPHGHANPHDFPLRGKQFDAGLVQLGGFTLGTALLHALPGNATVTPDPTTLPANMAASFTRHGDYLMTSALLDEPRLGDVRVSWSQVPLQELTIVARIDGDHLQPASDAADGVGYVVQLGDVPVLDVFPDLPIPPEFVWSWRILAVVLASLGAFILVAVKRGRGDPVLALGLGMAAVGIVASVLWLRGDPRLVGGWLALVLAGLGLVTWRLWRTR